jgi:ABC-type oligopeptide transport system ATPase subunit
VGESGCGKSTLSRALLGLQKISDGSILYKGKDLAQLNANHWRKLRKEIQIIFQDPYASLNPRIKAGDALAEAILVHQLANKANVHHRVRQLLDQVQLPAGAEHKYPHEFSGGQRQRICIARALAVAPELIICDESVSALDVKVQAQILQLLEDLQKEHHLTYLFITHDLHIVRHISDRIMVMQRGKIVEQGDTLQIMEQPQQAYTQALLAAAPTVTL